MDNIKYRTMLVRGSILVGDWGGMHIGKMEEG